MAEEPGESGQPRRRGELPPRFGLPGRTTGRELVMALGGFYLLLAVVTADEYLPNRFLAVVVFTFISASGFALLAGGYRLPRTGINPRFYGGIFWRSLAGVVLMAAALFIYHFQPDVDLAMPRRSVTILSGFSGVAGYFVGTADARAKTREHDLEESYRQLDRVKAELEESNERLEQFAYAASHDLREPLRTVRNYLDLIEQRYGDELGDDGEEFLEFALDGTERMRAMITGLLEYSRVESEGDSFEPVDLEEVLVDVRKNLEVRIDDAGGHIVLDDLPRVEGDEAQLQMLFQNLLSNAIRYSDGAPRVEVTADREDEMWAIAVRDDGIGIEPAQRDRIFEVFQRLHTHEEYDGTGIGLALCKRIVERHDGEIRVDSEPGQGSTFTVALPAV